MTTAPLTPTHPDQVLDRFLDYAKTEGIELYPAQEEAILELLEGKNLILNTPTGSGKSLVALALHFDSLSRSKRSFYTSPIKALVNEKFIALCRAFGPDRVGLITGDATVNPDADIICCTAEILAQEALRYGSRAAVDDVIMDEFHYYSDRERGVAWQIPLLTLPGARFLLMSATLGDTSRFEECMTTLNGRDTVVVRGMQRPVPLEYKYEDLPLHQTIARLIDRGRAPVYVVCFTQANCATTAQDLLSVDFCSKDEKRAIATALEGTDFSSPYGKDIQRLLRHGVGLHHGGLLPRYRILVERLAQKGLLKIIVGTDTLGVGVNIPIRTVLLTQLYKYDGQKAAILSVRDFHQIVGRAGRKGFDDLGTVVAQAPEHVIENLEAERKAAGDPKKLKKFVKRKPPEKGFVIWNKETFEKLIQGQPEALVSRMKVTHGMLLEVLSRTEDDGCRAMQKIIRTCHEAPSTRKRLGKHAFVLLRSLVDRGIIELAPTLKVHADLQQDFSIHHTLALFLIDTIKLLDPEHPEYDLDLLTLVESIVEDPDLILRRQLDRLKTEKMAELKAQGMEFDDRVAELDKLEHPKPNREFIYAHFNEFARAHPWVEQENVRPKSVAREMFETFQSFNEYIRDYELQRTEGLLLRYLTEVYKALAQTVPDALKTEGVLAIELYLREVVRGVDSSLIDEWEKMRNPDWVKTAESGAATLAPASKAADPRRLRITIRNAVFEVIRALSRGDFEKVVALAPGLDIAALEAKSALYAETHARVLTDTRARAAEYSKLTELSERSPQGGRVWRVEQTLLDPDSHNDWGAIFEVELPEAGDALASPRLRLIQLGSLAELH